jgi:hypothetical protein
LRVPRAFGSAAPFRPPGKPVLAATVLGPGSDLDFVTTVDSTTLPSKCVPKVKPGGAGTGLGFHPLRTMDGK